MAEKDFLGGGGGSMVGSDRLNVPAMDMFFEGGLLPG